ncbi:MAG: gliding motility protein GldC [Balneolaceae bacterium]|jgi:gliding motility-associated protein GldC
MAKKKKEISITVELDENDVPTSIDWNATDKEGEGIANCKAMILSMWDPDQQDTLRLDLWTKKMTVEEMKVFFHQTLVTMADTFQNSTQEEGMAEDMRDFTSYYAEKMEILDDQ